MPRPLARETTWGRSLSDFVRELGSDRPVPAGASAAAAAVAMAAGLVEKAARLSGEQWLDAPAVAKRGAVLRKVAAALAAADARAYTDYVRALRRARGLHTDRREALIAPARTRIVEVPLSIVRTAAEVARLASDAARHGNPNLASDAYVALELAAAAASAASVTLATNVRAARDTRLVEARRLASGAERLRREARRRA